MNAADIEERLRSLAPTPPDPALAARIETALAADEGSAPLRILPAAPRARRSSWMDRLGFALLGAAASYLLLPRLPSPAASEPDVVAANPAPGDTGSEIADFVPAETSTELVYAHDAGVMLDDSQLPVRLYHYQVLDKKSWENPITGARLEVQSPREAITMVPVNFQ